jgi:hypothetical protein
VVIDAFLRQGREEGFVFADNRQLLVGLHELIERTRQQLK